MKIRSKHSLAAMILCLSAMSLSGCGRSDESSPASGSMAKGSKDYVFTSAWFVPNIPRWKRLLAEFTGRPDVRYLEIGTFEGRSLFWMLDTILTHPDSRLVAIDIFFDDYEPTFLKNLQASGEANRITVIKDRGEHAMKDLDEESFDIIYIDGGHSAPTVFAQAAIGWQLLKVGGIMILDDYLWQGAWPLDLRPQLPIEAFLTAFGQEIEILDRGRDVVVRKIERACGEHYYCSPVTDGYVYVWAILGASKLIATDSGEEIELTPQERRALEGGLANLRTGQIGHKPPNNPLMKADYDDLISRLTTAE